MKKFVTLSLVLVMLLASAIAAADASTDSVQKVPVKLTLDPAFEWEVPAEADFIVPTGPTEGEIEANRITVSVTALRGMSPNKVLDIQVSREDLVLTNGEKTIDFQIGVVRDGKVDTSTQGQYQEVTEAPADVTFGTILDMTDVDGAPAGDYAGEITFTATLRQKSV